MLGTIVGGLVNGIGSFFNNIFGGMNAQQQAETNYYYNELAAQNADKRTRKLYEDYMSPSALRKQYESAGLSPSLMFGGGGVGGQTMPNGAQGEGTNGIQRPYYGMNPLEGAQLDLMAAQSRKLNAEADTVEGKNKRGEAEINELNARISNIFAQTKNEGLKSAWYEYENALQMLNVQYEASINEEKIQNFVTECEYMKHKTKIAKIKGEIDEATQQDVIRSVRENVRNIIADTLLKGSQVKVNESLVNLNNEQVENLANEIVNRDWQTEINQDTLDQAIRDWALHNGILTDERTSLKEFVLYKLFGDKKGDGKSGDITKLIVMLLKAIK